MQDRYLFEYAVLRFVPRVEREEFLNIGVVLYCREKKFLGMRSELNHNRLLAFSGLYDAALFAENLDAFSRICEGVKGAGPISLLDMPSRFRWLTARRSTILQSSAVHPGFCTDPQETLLMLCDQMVKS
jgi:hypothetical protein